MRASPGKILHRRITVDMTPGADPDAIDDPSEVYGDRDGLDIFPDIFIACENPSAPNGECHYNAVGLEPDRCKYCGRRTG